MLALTGKRLFGPRAGLLLDVENLYANQRNHGLDAEAFLSRLPLSHLDYVHVAGGAPRPANLFSHSDQDLAMQSAVHTGLERIGWGGRIADLLGADSGFRELGYLILAVTDTDKADKDAGR